MGRIVAIDYGTKRVGIATTDPLQMIASPLDTVHSKDVINFLKEYNAREEIEAFVVGMPKNLQNEDTNATIHVKQFVVVLKKTFPEKEVHLMDERFTSKMALQTMITGGTKKKDRAKKENLDKISATIILQSYLASKL
jgi:putative Holliday junction resolvase